MILFPTIPHNMNNSKVLKVRQFKEEDADGVSQVIRKTMLETNADDYPISILKPLHDYFSPSKVQMLSLERFCVVTLIGKKIIGTGAFEGGELKTIFVNPDYQRQGVGKAIIFQLEQYARKEGYGTIRVPSSISGTKFYEKMGYEKGETFISKHAGQQTWMKKHIS